MPPTTAALRQVSAVAEERSPDLSLSPPVLAETLQPDRPHHRAAIPQDHLSPFRSASDSTPEHRFRFQPRGPALIGEISFRGWVPVDGILSGQLGANGGGISIKQRPRTSAIESEPELTGEICFRDLLRVDGHVAGKILSEKGTLIISIQARVDADIEANTVMISGEVNGNVVAYNRVELSPGAVITGNISAGSLEIRPGAVFHGSCCMLKKNGNR